MSIISKEQVERLRAAYAEILAVEGEIEEAAGCHVYITTYHFRTGPPEVHVHGADLVPANVPPRRSCGGGQIVWSWEENGARIERRVQVEDYLDEIGATDRLPKRAGDCVL